jgi:heat shock protein HslJ
VSRIRFGTVALCVFIVLAAAAFTLTGCGSSAGSVKALEAHQWKVTKLKGVAYTGHSDVTATFAANNLAGSTGINLYTGTFQSKKANDISITVSTMTRAAGAPAAMKVEADYLAALAQATSFAVDEDSLELFDASGGSLVSYVVEVPMPLVGTKWKMVSYNNGSQGFESAASSATVTAVFGKDGSLTGNGGVNPYHTSYETSGTSSIAIQPPTSGMAAGPKDISKQEKAYFTALVNSTRYYIEGKKLTLRAADDSAQVGYEAE